MVRTTRSKILLGISGALVVGLGVWAYVWWSTPPAAIGVAESDSGDVLGTNTALVPWRTTYFSTKIPSNLRLKNSNDNPTGAIMGQYLLTSLVRGQTDQIAVTIGRLNSGSLRDVSGVRLRLNDPDDYQLATRPFAPAGAIVFSAATPYETDVFWQHDDLYISVAVSGTGDRQADLEQTLRSIITNWQW